MTKTPMIAICRAEAPEFEVAWAQHARSVFERCMSLMSGRRDHVEEAFSRTSFVAFQKYPAHRNQIHNVRHWLLRLAYNVCMDLHRERARQARLCDLEPIDAEAVEAIDAQRHSADHEACLLGDEQIAVLRAAVARLAPRLRAPLELRLRGELSDRGIAGALQLTEATVRKRLQEARAALKPMLLAYRRGDRLASCLTNQVCETSNEWDPERLNGPAEVAPVTYSAGAHAQVSAIVERK